MENKVFLRRTTPKPYPIKGAWLDSKSPATHACILKNPSGFYEVNVWDRTIWSESSYSLQNRYVKLSSYEDAKIWLIEHYGGKWCKEKKFL